MKILKFLAENLVCALLLTIMSFILGIFELPDSRVILPAFWAQMGRNYVVSYICVTAVRIISPYVKRIPDKWTRKTAERYEKIFIVAFYAGALLIAYLLLRSIGGQSFVIPLFM